MKQHSVNKYPLVLLLKFIFKGIYPAETALSSLSLFNLSEQPIKISQSSLNTIQ